MIEPSTSKAADDKQYFNKQMRPFGKLCSMESKNSSPTRQPKIHIALSREGCTNSMSKDHEEILFKDCEVYVNENGKIGLMPTILHKIQDVCPVPLQGQLVSYYSTRKQNFVNLGQFPLKDTEHAVSPSEIV